ncbi:hypothetical protein J4772_24445 [Cohnella sp. LGH]|uniref:hypothetical protein n=1 Tax=Cohnella sp. LGH TaxID=1619153 RepID=UPI001ADAEDBF|nr:hypothetical protein [Cohnella sp. LGH]QTH40705.1 hypothetical protein J4772_24445 [Cohnella sp. LGH]
MMRAKIVVLTTLLFSLFGSHVFAAQPTDAGTFPNNWYSDYGSIGYFPHSQSGTTQLKIKTQASSACLMDASTLSTLSTYGFDQWGSSLSLSRTSTTSSDYHIFTTCISGLEATELGLPSNTVGYSPWETSEVLYYAKTNTNVTKYVARLAKSKVYLIWNGTTMFYSTNKWKSIIAHEYGHALGYIGHDSTSSINNKAIMSSAVGTFYDSWQLTAPTTRDFTHIRNSYHKFYS